MLDKPFESMNVIPLVDVMLVLLTIVLTTSTFIATGRIPVNLPQASAAKNQDAKPQTVMIAPDDTVYLNSRPVSMEELKASLNNADRQTPYLIRADRDVRLQKFIDVLDLLKQMNFTKVAVATQNKH